MLPTVWLTPSVSSLCFFHSHHIILQIPLRFLVQEGKSKHQRNDMMAQKTGPSNTNNVELTTFSGTRTSEALTDSHMIQNSNSELDSLSTDGLDLSILQESRDGSDSDDDQKRSAGGSQQHQLREENNHLRSQVEFLRQQLLHYQNHSPTTPQGTSNNPQNTKPRRKSRRRWSLSSVTRNKANKHPELAAFHRPLEDGTIVLFHDELDHNTSGRGLHHRRVASGSSVLPPKQIKQPPPRRPAQSTSKRKSSSSTIPGKEGMSRKFSDIDLKTEDDSHGFFDDSYDEEYGDDMEQERLLVNSSNPEVSSGEPAADEPGVRLDLDFYDDVKDRAGWLVGLLILQSLSSFIIKQNEELLEDHIIIVQFLTMLVGAGGNAGNQASVRVIRGLATGVVTDRNAKDFLWKEMVMGLVLAMIIAVSGCLRAIVFAVPIPETLAITTSLWCIVFMSIAIGALLPLLMKYVGIDPAHSSTTIQVVMDILGVTITVSKYIRNKMNNPRDEVPTNNRALFQNRCEQGFSYFGLRND